MGARIAGMAAGAGLAAAMSLSAGTSVQAEPLSNNLFDLTGHYLNCFELMFSDPALHAQICGQPGPAGPADNDGDLAGPGGGGALVHCVRNTSFGIQAVNAPSSPPDYCGPTPE